MHEIEEEKHRTKEHVTDSALQQLGEQTEETEVEEHELSDGWVDNEPGFCERLLFTFEEAPDCEEGSECGLESWEEQYRQDGEVPER